MAAPEYTLFVAPYLEGWANGEEGGTPMTAEILNENYDAFLLALNEWAAAMGVAVAAIPTKTSDLTNDSNFAVDASYVHTDNNYTTNEKNKLSGIEANANNYTLPTASTSTKGGVKVDGTTITIDGNGVISSTGGGGATALSNLTDVAISSLANAQILMYNTTTSKWENVTPSFGTDVEGNPSGTPSVVLTAIKIGNTIYSIPGGGGGGSSVSFTQILSTGTKIGTITIDGVPTDIYAPTAPTKTSDLTNDSNFVSDASYVHTDNNYTTNEKNKLADLNQVEANPSSGTSAGDLSSIEIGGTKYNIPSGGGGGTTVVANPSGAATDELEKIQIGSTIYAIPEGSGERLLNDILTGEDNTKVTASSSDSASVPAWKAFDGIKGTSSGTYANPYYSWLAGNGDAPCWLQYHFEHAYYVDSVKIWAYCNNQTYTGSAKIQGSNDGTNWTDISESVSLSIASGVEKEYDFTCDGNQYQYVRLYSAQAFAVHYEASIFIGEMEIYGRNNPGGSGGHTILNDAGTSLAQEDDLQFKGVYSHDDSTNGKTVVEVTRSMTLAEYSLLSADEKKGVIVITDEDPSPTHKDLTVTLTAGSTSVTFTDAAITATCLIDPYTDSYGVNPKSILASVGAVTLIFDEQSTDIGVCIRISESNASGGNS